MSKENKLPRHYHPGYTFINKGDYYHARKIGLAGSRVHIDPLFHETRQKARNFGSLSSMAAAIVNSLTPYINMKDGYRNLFKMLLEVAGEESYTTGRTAEAKEIDWSLLEGYEFNSEAPIEKALLLPVELAWTERKKHISWPIPSFVPESYIVPPAGISHARILLINTVLDIETLTTKCFTARTTQIPIKKLHFPGTSLTVEVVAGKHLLNIICVAVTWYSKEDRSPVTKKAGIPAAAYMPYCGFVLDN